MAAWNYGDRIGRSGRDRTPRLLASEYELADQHRRAFIPGVPGLRNQKAVRRAEFSRLRPLQLRSKSSHRMGTGASNQGRKGVHPRPPPSGFLIVEEPERLPRGAGIQSKILEWTPRRSWL